MLATSTFEHKETMNMHFTGRTDESVLDKLDMMAIQDQRSRAFMLELAIKEAVERFEHQHGPIEVQPKKLEEFRNRRRAG